MRKFLETIILVLCSIIVLAGCAGVPKEQKIQEDLENYSNSEFLQKGEKIQEVEIDKRETEKKQKTDIVWCYVTTAKSGIAYKKYVCAVYYKYDKDWELSDVTVNSEDNWEVTPLKGIGKSEIPGTLESESVTVDDESWEIEDDGVAKVTIMKQETDLEKKTDHVIMKVVLDGEVEKAEGTITADYKFGEDSWELVSASDGGDFKSEIKKSYELNVTEEDLLDEIDGRTVEIGGTDDEDGIHIVTSDDIQKIILSKDELKDFKIDKQETKYHGTKQIYQCSGSLAKSDVTYSLNIEVDYIYDDESGWESPNVQIEVQAGSIDLQGEWTGTYHGAGDSGTAVLHITAVGGENVTATYSYLPDKPSKYVHTGSYNLSGTFDKSKMTLKLQAGDWIEQPDKPLSIEKQDITAMYYIDEGKIKGTAQQGFPFEVAK